MLFNMLPRSACTNLVDRTFSYAKLDGKVFKRRSIFSARPNSGYVSGGKDVVPINFALTSTSSNETWRMKVAQSDLNSVHVVIERGCVLKIVESIVRFDPIDVVYTSSVYPTECVHDEPMNLPSKTSVFIGQANLGVSFIRRVCGKQRLGDTVSPRNNPFNSAKIRYCIVRKIMNGFPLFLWNRCLGSAIKRHFWHHAVN